VNAAPDLPEHWTIEPLHPDDLAPEGNPDHDCDGSDGE
jgi:hypothetical protein